MAGRGGMARQNTRIRPGWPCRHGPAACAWPRATARSRAPPAQSRQGVWLAGAVQGPKALLCPGPPRFGGWSCDRFTCSQPCGWGRMGGSRTRDTRVISTLLYPTELPVEACPESNRGRNVGFHAHAVSDARAARHTGCATPVSVSSTHWAATGTGRAGLWPQPWPASDWRSRLTLCWIAKAVPSRPIWAEIVFKPLISMRNYFLNPNCT